MRLIGHHAGITLGFYGTSHHATEDLAIMRSIADLAVVAPATVASLPPVRACDRDIRARSTSASRAGATRGLRALELPASSSAARSCSARRRRDADRDAARRSHAALDAAGCCAARASTSACSTCTRSSRSMPRRCSRRPRAAGDRDGRGAQRHRRARWRGGGGAGGERDRDRLRRHGHPRRVQPDRARPRISTPTTASTPRVFGR